MDNMNDDAEDGQNPSPWNWKHVQGSDMPSKPGDKPDSHFPSI